MALLNTPIINNLNGNYCNSLTRYSRYITREVQIGDCPMGGNNPIRIQSMTTTDTMDTIKTVEQTIRMVDAGCEYVRITAPSIKEAENLAEIKKELKKRGYNIPLVADIHFTPNAAEAAARIVEKVRVNPGNYADKKKFEHIEYTDISYTDELERISKRFIPLIKVCKEYGTAMRIGTNHGSLSDRILSRYGDTPEGMVESAMEFIRICEDQKYFNLVISMKASNAQVMVQAYRLLVKTMNAEAMNYPLHLGVTEAGDGEDGRIKSAVGIGTLLEDGLGDTIRVSLTEEPEFEIPVARMLAQRYEKRIAENVPSSEHSEKILTHLPIDPYSYTKRNSRECLLIGKGHVPVVIADISQHLLKDPTVLNGIGYNYSPLLDKYNMSDMAADFAYMGDNLPSYNFPGNLKQLYNYSTWHNLKEKENTHPVLSVHEYKTEQLQSSELNFVKAQLSELDTILLEQLEADPSAILVLETSHTHGMAEQRMAFFELLIQNKSIPVIIKRDYPKTNEEEFQLHSSTDVGALFLDGFGDGIWLSTDNKIPLSRVNTTAFGILQATRTRISKTEYISCPSCGRTLFDLQETTQLIRKRTDHLKGIKIGIMGCIVNGPGEMADADYGYVGTGPGKITLYRGKEVVRKNVNTESAVDELIEIIKEDAKWIDPPLINHLN